MYQLIPDTVMGAATCIKRTADNAFIPFDPANSAYAEYLVWLAEGNTPLPADPPPPPDPKLAGIEFEGVMCSATKDDQAGLIAILLASQIQGAGFAPTVFNFSNGARLTVTKTNIAALTAVWMPFRQSFFAPIHPANEAP
jgi:hypothetical protein